MGQTDFDFLISVSFSLRKNYDCYQKSCTGKISNQKVILTAFKEKGALIQESTYTCFLPPQPSLSPAPLTCSHQGQGNGVACLGFSQEWALINPAAFKAHQ